MADHSTASPAHNPILIGLAGWVFPGLGYFLIKDRVRGAAIAASILFLFIGGLLIGGVRCLDVPGYNAHGRATYYYVKTDTSKGVTISTLHVTDNPSDSLDASWSLTSHPLDEIRAKPWSIPQILLGPIDLLCDWWCVAVSQPKNPDDATGERIAARSHSRVNELGVLYTGIAGMLNLLAIIDAAHRAGRTEAK